MWGPLGKIFLVCIVVAVTVCTLAVHTAAIRLTFAMARDNALPFGEKLARVNPEDADADHPGHRHRRASRSLILVINIGQPKIFTVLTSIAIIMIYLAYLMVTGPMLKKRFQGQWPPKDLKAERLLHHGPLGHAGQHRRRGLGRRDGAEPGLAARRGVRRALVQHLGCVRLHRRDPRRGSALVRRQGPPPHRNVWSRMQRGEAEAEELPMSDTEFDYVIAGGGTAGCVLAARLSEDPDVTVCLVEAGPSDVGDSQHPPAVRVDAPAGLRLRLGLSGRAAGTGNSFMRHARAKVLGGCSSHNSCIAFWPPAECLDEWVKMGATGWGAAEILPLVKRLENNDAPGDHGHDGPVRLQDVPPNDPCGAAVLEAAALAGLPTVAFNRGETVRNGAGWFQINVGEDGTRMSTSHAYLHPILDTRSNLEVRTGCWVSEILFDEANNATGVRYQRPDLTGYDTVSARREVIVTAGSIDTPKLLMLSGIGPAEHLREIGVPVRVDSPGVGSNLDDHVEGLVFWEASRPMVTTSTQWWEIGLFTTVDEGSPQPDLMMHYGSVPFDMNTLRRGYPTTDNGFCLTPNVTQGRSRGTVRLRSLDFRDRPKVDPRYFTDPEGYDERIMLTGLRLARTIAEQAPLRGWIARELAPGPDATTDDELLDYVHKTHNTVYHPAATARMGSATDPMAVLDPELRVKGVSRLRVVDASAMPKLPAVNPNITVMTMAEKCADLIRGT